MKLALLSVGLFLVSPLLLQAQEQKLGPSSNELAKARTKAIAFLKTTQADDGSWTSSEAVGISALVAYGLLRSGVPADDPTVAKTLDYLTANSRDDGRICSARSRTSGYETCVALMALKETNASGKYDKELAKAETFIRSLQFDEKQELEKSDDRYGGAGYGPGGGRPDLSNTAFLVEALKAAGAKQDDPSLQKALIFVSRCQNLESEHNTSPLAAKVNDGGFYYTVSAGGASPAGDSREGGLQSYGSMTYAGLKSMIYVGVGPDDPRVKAATKWIEKNYTVTDNPGMGNNGLFYYYQLFAKALDTMKLDRVVDEDGKQHDWRKELAEHLIKLQKDNGSWVNTSPRWFEGDPNLVTAYTLIALSYCDAPTEKKAEAK